MVARITFRSEIYIEADTMDDIVEAWERIPLWSQEADSHNVDFVEVVSVEDANTYKDLTNEFNEFYP